MRKRRKLIQKSTTMNVKIIYAEQKKKNNNTFTKTTTIAEIRLRAMLICKTNVLQLVLGLKK